MCQVTYLYVFSKSVFIFPNLTNYFYGSPKGAPLFQGEYFTRGRSALGGVVGPNNLMVGLSPPIIASKTLARAAG